MTAASTRSSFSKGDVERMVREIVPPLVESTVDRAIARLQSTLATDIARGVSQALAEQNAKLGLDTTTPAGIREAQRRNMHVDEWIAGRTVVEERWKRTDDFLRDMTPDVIAWCKNSHRRHEDDTRTIRDQVIRWSLTVLAGALVAVFGIWWHEGGKPAVAPVEPIVIRSAPVEPPVQTSEPTAGK